MKATTKTKRIAKAKSAPREQRFIGETFRYFGDWHPGIRGYEVVLKQVLRGTPDDYVILRTDEELGALLPDDVIEFAPIIRDGGTTRASWVTSDGHPSHIERLDGTLVLPVRRAAARRTK